jgi:hypothetical protein
MSGQVPPPRLPPSLRIHKRIWLWVQASMAVGWFVVASYVHDKFLLILCSAGGGATIAFLGMGIVTRYVIAPRFRDLYPPASR